MPAPVADMTPIVLFLVIAPEIAEINASVAENAKIKTRKRKKAIAALAVAEDVADISQRT